MPSSTTISTSDLSDSYLQVADAMRDVRRMLSSMPPDRLPEVQPFLDSFMDIVERSISNRDGVRDLVPHLNDLATLMQELVGEEEGAVSEEEESLEEVEEEEGEEKCIMCMGVLNPKKKAKETRLLHCNHRFHQKCIDRWLRTASTCPVCRSMAAYMDA